MFIRNFQQKRHKLYRNAVSTVSDKRKHKTNS